MTASSSEEVSGWWRLQVNGVNGGTISGRKVREGPPEEKAFSRDRDEEKR